MDIPQVCATDKEIFDVLMSRRKSLSNTVLHGLAHGRRIFCSEELRREDLCDYLSALPHDYNDLATIIERSEPPERGERATFVTFDGELSPPQIKEAIEEYSKLGTVDRVSIPMQAAKVLTARVDYTEFDFSKTRLAQRRPKEATLIFTVESGKTTVRLPANEKARGIVEGIRTKLESLQATPAPIVADELSLAKLNTPELRTSFFTNLIRSTPKHKLQSVVGLKVASFDGSDNDDEEGGASVEPELLTVVTRALLAGENLIATPQFRSLQEAGFFICAIRWHSREEDEPRELIQFDVSLDNPVSGSGIRYLVRHAASSTPPVYFKRLEDIRERNLLSTIEAATRKTLDEQVTALLTPAKGKK